MAPGKITNEAFETKTALRPNFKAGMDATTAEESFATILGDGSGWMSKKFNDFDFSFGRHLSLMTPNQDTCYPNHHILR